MKITTAVSVVALFTLMAPLAASVEGSEAAAESPALAWLRLLDAGSYTQSWSAASTLFRARTSQSLWRSKAATARGVMGPLVSRNLQSVVFARTVRGEPDGEYAIVRFSSRFAWLNNEQTVYETVVMRKDADGIWRAADFYIPYIPFAK